MIRLVSWVTARGDTVHAIAVADVPPGTVPTPHPSSATVARRYRPEPSRSPRTLCLVWDARAACAHLYAPHASNVSEEP